MSLLNSAVLAALSILSGLVLAQSQPGGAPTVVQTKSGKVRGSLRGKDGQEYVEFLGIPYTKPPVGELRFKRPQPVEPWSGTRDASGFGHRCWQRMGFMPKLEEFLLPKEERHFKARESSEDCLTLNIYCPAKTRSGLRAVMVWIHGGAFNMGAGHEYPMWRLAVHGDVIGVTFNYRLGIFGFLSTGDEVIPGNFGMLDQQMALAWVHENIEYFGGDNTRITIFGESAGGASVSHLSISPRSLGLFQRSIMMSGTAAADWSWVAAEKAREAAEQVATQMKCDTSSSTGILACLSSSHVTPEMLLNASLPLIMPTNLFVPVIDGFFLPEYPKKILESKSSEGAKVYNGLDIMAGLTNKEGGMWLLMFGGDVTDGVAKESALMHTYRIGQMFTQSESSGFAAAKAVEDVYFNRKDLNNIEIADNLVDLFTDEFITAPTVYKLNQHEGNGRTYFFCFSHNPFQHALLDLPHPSWFTGANHGDEVGYLFGLFNAQNIPPEELELSAIMMTHFANFAKYGTPSDDWPEYTMTKKQYMDYNIKPSPKENFLPERMDLWLNKLPNIAKRKDHEEL